jgi:putative component of toxin-antitoxin plasmid stabilization module
MNMPNGSRACEIGKRGETLVIMLAGGDKRTQNRDMRTALELAREL